MVQLEPEVLYEGEAEDGGDRQCRVHAGGRLWAEAAGADECDLGEGWV